MAGALATPHALATEAGGQAYRDGGTAIDAAIAAAAVLTVVYPHNVALGGDLIALVRTPDGAVHCVNASGWAGVEVDGDGLRSRYGQRLPTRGADTVTVPGGVRGWESLRRFGSRLTWTDTLAAAERAARVGTPVARSLAAAIADEGVDLFGDLRRGDQLSQPALGDTFAEVRASGADAFYEGALAARTVAFLRGRGSSLTAADFAAFQPQTTAPIAVDFGGLTVRTSPPNTHGFILLRALRAIEGLGMRSPLIDDLGRLMRVFHHGNALRADFLADSRHSDVDVSALVGDGLDEVTALETGGAGSAVVPRGDTVGVAAADDEGYAVSVIQSLYHSFGSGLLDPVTGVLFHNRGTSFSLDSRSPNVIAPRKRPAHTLMPVMTTSAGAVRHVLATMGGQGQPQILCQVLLRALGGASAEAAVSAPRAVVGRQTDGATVDSLSFESDVAPAAESSILTAGLSPRRVPPHTEALGHTNVVFAYSAGRLSAASDPRSDGAAVVVSRADS